LKDETKIFVFDAFENALNWRDKKNPNLHIMEVEVINLIPANRDQFVSWCQRYELGTVFQQTEFPEGTMFADAVKLLKIVAFPNYPQEKAAKE
jgi:hypothetical protein